MRWPAERNRTLLTLGTLALLQAALFYDHYAVSLTFLFGVGIGIWLRHWTAGLWALAVFVPSFLLAALTGWMGWFRLLWEPLLGGALAFLGGLIGGGIFQVLNAESGTPIEES